MIKFSLSVRSKEWMSGVATTPTCSLHTSLDNSMFNSKSDALENPKESLGLGQDMYSN